MSFKISCPHCAITLNVAEATFGKTVSCPGCNQLLKVPQPAATPPSPPPAEHYAPAARSVQERRPARVLPLPSGMPPMPDGGPSAQSPSDPWAFLQAGSGPTARDKVPRPAAMPSVPPAETFAPAVRSVPESRPAQVVPVPLPHGMPPMPNGDSPMQSPSDPLAFLQGGANPTPRNGTTTGRPDSIVSSETMPNSAEAKRSAAVSPVRISALRHPKESVYFAIAAIAGALLWLSLIPFVIMFFWVAIPILIGMWIFKQRYKAEMLGNSVKVSRNQYSELFEIVQRHCRALGLAVPPAVFVVNMNGMVNAFAMKILKDKYVMLYSDLIDLMFAHGSTTELSSIIGHELGHHAAGHTGTWKRLLLMPAMFIPFLGGAYSRACELTADRIGLHLCGDKDAACRGLIALACGSKVLSPKTNLQAFKDQEGELPWLFAFWNDLYAAHPRLTKRVLAIEDAARLVPRSG